MLETQFYLNIHDATPRACFKLSLAFNKIHKGGSAQFWQLVSREMAIGYKEGQISKSEAEELVQTRLAAKSSKFFLTQECLNAMGIEEDAAAQKAKFTE